MFTEFLRNRFWFLPTKEDQAKTKYEDYQRSLEKMTEITHNRVRMGSEIGRLSNEFEITLGPEQRSLYLNLKSKSQENHFLKMQEDYHSKVIYEYTFGKFS